MDKAMSGLAFRGMSFIFGIRDLFQSLDRMLDEVPIGNRDQVLDYGCGPGSYSIAAAKRAKQGTVYALDIQPLAQRYVRKRALRQELDNIKPIQSDCDTGLPDDSIDIVLLYDIFHMFDEPDRILTELQRVLKAGGILSVSDHHMRGQNLVARVTSSGLFELSGTGNKTFSFRPRNNQTD